VRGLSRDGLHVILWQRRDGRDCIRLDQNRLGDEFGIEKPSMSRIVQRMVNEGRMERLAGQKNQRRTFKLVDPRVYFAEHPPPAEVLRAAGRRGAELAVEWTDELDDEIDTDEIDEF
jgi:hypothetical protein